MPAPVIPVYIGNVPSRNQAPAEFATNADQWLAYQSPLAANYNGLATYLDQLSIDTENTATQILDDTTLVFDNTVIEKDQAALFAAAAEASADVAQSAVNFKGQWSDLTGALNIPSTVENNGSLWVLLNDLADVTLSEPTSVNVDWLDLGGTFAQKSYIDEPSGTFIRKAVNTYFNVQGVTARSYTLDASTYPIGYLVYLVRLLETSGITTVTTDEGTILLPDGTSNATQTLEAVGVIALIRTASGWTARKG